MAVIQSYGGLRDVVDQWRAGASHGSMQMYDQYSYAYATLYRTQPNVRTCVDFLARNIAQLGLHVFERVNENDRRRLREHPLARLIEKPNPWTTRYRLIESLIADMGIYWNAFWLKLQLPGGMALLRVPPTYVQVMGGLVPTMYRIDLGMGAKDFGPEQVVHFRGYSPESPTTGLSPLETLRRVLAEEHAMGQFREGFWQNGARMYGVIERPKDAGDWSPEARERFRTEFEELYTGQRNSGRTAILEEGMTWKQQQFDAQESEYLGSRKLTREECARAYHIPLPMVGILDHATFSNIRDQHKQLYQDCMGPWLTMLEEEIGLQLLPDLDKSGQVYVEFNIQEKLQGSFEEQAAVLQSATGRPWMTANEARARMNLPHLDGDADKLVMPLNVMVDEEPTANTSAVLTPTDDKAAQTKAAKPKRIDPTRPRARAQHEKTWRRMMERTFARQRDAVLARIPEKAARADGTKQAVTIGEVWDGGRWNRELQQDMFRLGVATATEWARYVTEELDVDLDDERMLPWLEENSRISAEEINATTREAVGQALAEDDPRVAVQHLFDVLLVARAAQIATSRVTTTSQFGASEGARQAGLRSKTWQVNSSNPRPEHSAMAGETVGLGELFSNGMRWPGDPAGGADNNSNCQCSCVFGA